LHDAHTRVAVAGCSGAGWSATSVVAWAIGEAAWVGGGSRVLFAELGEGEQAADVGSATQEAAFVMQVAEVRDEVAGADAEAAAVSKAAGVEVERVTVEEGGKFDAAEMLLGVERAPLPPPRSSSTPVGVNSFPSTVDRWADCTS
jgi:hypothetical protein